MDVMLYVWYNKPLASATLVAVPPGGKSVELDPNPNYYYYAVCIKNKTDFSLFIR
jgi:hypothetical protein